MEKRYFIKVSHIEDDGRYYINYYGTNTFVIARDYKFGERHNVSTLRSDYIKRHGYKTQKGAENSYFFKHFANNEYWKPEIIWYYC